MTIAEAPGTLPTGKIQGTLSSVRLGSMGAGKFSSGTVSRPVSNAPFGSFGTITAALLRPSMGSFAGSVSAKRLQAAGFPGTWRLIAGAGVLPAYNAAPARARFVSVVVQLSPDVTNASSAHLRQRGQGTISAVRRSSDVSAQVTSRELSGWVLPGRGSYVVGSQGGAAGNVTVTSWTEWDT